MNLEEMWSLADHYTHDYKGRDTLTPALWVGQFNQAQDRLIAILKRGIITDLQETETARVLGTSGQFNTQSLGQELWRGMEGIDGIKHTNGNYCRKISFAEHRRYSDYGKEYTPYNPKYYVRGSYIYVLPYDGYTIDIYYIRKPIDMAFATTETSSNTDCELDIMFHELIVGLALEDYIDESPAATRFFNRTMGQIATMNEQYEASDTTRDGTTTYMGSNNSSYHNIMRY